VATTPLTALPFPVMVRSMKNDALITHISTPGLSLARFGEKIGRAGATVHRYAHGHRIPDPETMIAIEAASDGAVPVSSWEPLVLARAMPQEAGR
jgi:hypothetical protein